MKIILFILTLNLFSAFQVTKETTIKDFVSTQHDFEVIQNSKKERFVNTLLNQKLHNEKYEVHLKAKRPHSNKNSYDKTVYTRIQIWQFKFETPEKRKQATDSLFTCFPFDCANIKSQVNQGIKITPSIWIFKDKAIYIANTNCEQVDEKWKNFKIAFSETFAENDSEIIVTECGKLS